MTIIENVGVFLIGVAIDILACWICGFKKRTLAVVSLSDLVGGVACIATFFIFGQIKKSTLLLSGLFGIIGYVFSLLF
ncbi:MAG: hypothetical protein ACI4MI_05255 [Christensenellales bacterium]